MKRFAFTLSEILITLGIVGVVAALTIPNVITVYQKKAAVAGILEAQSILSQAVKMYTAETDEEGAIFFDTTLPIEEFAQKYFLPYLRESHGSHLFSYQFNNIILKNLYIKDYRNKYSK